MFLQAWKCGKVSSFVTIKNKNFNRCILFWGMTEKQCVNRCTSLHKGWRKVQVGEQVSHHTSRDGGFCWKTTMAINGWKLLWIWNEWLMIVVRRVVVPCVMRRIKYFFDRSSVFGKRNNTEQSVNIKYERGYSRS